MKSIKAVAPTKNEPPPTQERKGISMKTLHSNYFYGNKVSDYGIKNGHVDYATLAKAFDAVLNNEIIKTTANIGYWETENGAEEYYEDNNGCRYTYDEKEDRVEELESELENLRDRLEECEDNLMDDSIEEIQARIDEIEEDLNSLYYAYYQEIYQYYIISYNGAEILKEWTDEIVFYNEELDMYVWGVTHWGTGWDYVLTDIKIENN